MRMSEDSESATEGRCTNGRIISGNRGKDQVIRLSERNFRRSSLQDICDQIDGKENGTYVLLSKFEDDVIFEYHITVMDHEFNLGILTMRLPEGVYAVNFDED